MPSVLSPECLREIKRAEKAAFERLVERWFVGLPDKRPEVNDLRWEVTALGEIGDKGIVVGADGGAKRVSVMLELLVACTDIDDGRVAPGGGDQLPYLVADAKRVAEDQPRIRRSRGCGCEWSGLPNASIERNDFAVLRRLSSVVGVPAWHRDLRSGGMVLCPARSRISVARRDTSAAECAQRNPAHVSSTSRRRRQWSTTGRACRARNGVPGPYRVDEAATNMPVPNGAALLEGKFGEGNVTRSSLDEDPIRGLEELCKVVAEAHRRADVARPVCRVRRLLRLDPCPSHVRQIGDARLVKRDTAEPLFKGAENRIHHRGVKCMRGEQTPACDGLLRERFLIDSDF